MPSNKRFLGGLIGADPLRAKTGAVAGDSNWSDVVLLLDGSSDTTDASGNQTISETGNVTPVTATGHPYATSALDFDTSTTSYLRTGTTADFKFGTNPFTIEFWMKPDTLNTSASSGSYSSIMENESGTTYTGSWWHLTQLNGELYFGVNSGATSITTSGSGISTSSWSHVAIVRNSSNNCTIYVDGVAKGSTTMSNNLTDGNNRTLTIGKQLSVSRRYDGQLTDIRITKGIARYTTTFTPPTSALTNTIPSGTVQMRLDGTTADDQSPSGLNDATLTGTASANDTTVTDPYGGSTGSYALDGSVSGNYLNTPNIAFGTNDFTIETWVYFDSLTPDASFNYQTLFSQGYSTTGAIALQTGDGNGTFILYLANSDEITSSIACSAGGWHHIALTRNGNVFTLFVDGADAGSVTNSINLNNTSNFEIGNTSSYTQYGIDGYIKDFRVITGTSLYPFHPPASSFPQQATIPGEAFQDPGNVDRVTANVGVLSLDTAGPEDATVTEYTLADYTAYSETQITASNNNTSDSFGCGCDISGDGTITVFGAPLEDGATNTISNSGAVYVYENGTEVAILRAASPAANDSLGLDVAISKDGSTIVASAYQGDSGDGEIYVFEKPTNGWANGTSSIILTHTPDQTGENLGITLAISDNGDTVVAGTRYGSTTSYSAEAFVFEKPSGGWASMTTETAKLSAASGAYDDKFSYGLSISGDGSVIAVGAPENNGGQTESGTVYLYDKPSGGWVDATETHLLSAPSRVAYEHFGQSCSLNEDGTLLVVGADGHSTNRGRVHVFEDSSGTWSHKALLTSTDTSSNQHIGMAVAVSRTGTTVAASAPGYNSDEGAIYVWMKPSAGWANGTNDFLLTAANGSAANNDQLGGPAFGTLSLPQKLALDTDGGKVVTSSVNDDDTNTNSGSGFLFAATTTVPGSVSTTTKGSQWFWGGMRGRNAISSSPSLADTGILSLPERSVILPDYTLSFITEYTALANGDSASVNISSDVSSGDLLLCMEHADNAGSSEPGAVPSGFTRLAASKANAVWQRLSYKIADGTETTVTAGLTGGHNSSVHLLIFRSSGGSVSSVTPSTFNTETNASSFPSSPQSVTASSSTADATVVFAAAANGGNNDVDFTAGSNITSQYKTYNGGISNWTSISGYALYNGPASDHSIDWSYSSSARPTAVSGYLEVSL